MQHERFTMDPSENDALSLEYKLHEGCALRHLDLADVINYSPGLRLVRPEETGLEEEVLHFVGPNFRQLDDDVRD